MTLRLIRTLLLFVSCVAVCLCDVAGCDRRLETSPHLNHQSSTPSATMPDILNGTPEPPPPQP